MGDDEENLSSNRDGDPDGMPEDPGSITAKGEQDALSSNEGSDSGGDESDS